jgi:hypothetical protein
MRIKFWGLRRTAPIRAWQKMTVAAGRCNGQGGVPEAVESPSETNFYMHISGRCPALFRAVRGLDNRPIPDSPAARNIAARPLHLSNGVPSAPGGVERAGPAASITWTGAPTGLARLLDLG